MALSATFASSCSSASCLSKRPATDVFAFMRTSFWTTSRWLWLLLCSLYTFGTFFQMKAAPERENASSTLFVRTRSGVCTAVEHRWHNSLPFCQWSHGKVLYHSALKRHVRLPHVYTGRLAMSVIWQGFQSVSSPGITTRTSSACCTLEQAGRFGLSVSRSTTALSLSDMCSLSTLISGEGFF